MSFKRCFECDMASGIALLMLLFVCVCDVFAILPLRTHAYFNARNPWQQMYQFNQLGASCLGGKIPFLSNSRLSSSILVNLSDEMLLITLPSVLKLIRNSTNGCTNTIWVHFMRMSTATQNTLRFSMMNDFKSQSYQKTIDTLEFSCHFS